MIWTLNIFLIVLIYSYFIISDSQVNVGFGIDTGFHDTPITDEDVITATNYAIQEIYGTSLISKIIYAKKKDEDGTRYQLTVSCKNQARTVCKVMLFNVLDRYGELYLDSYDTLMDGAC